MSDQFNPITITIPTANQMTEYLEGLAGAARKALSEVYSQAKAGQPISGALVALDAEIGRLREFGEQAAPIIAGLHEYARTVTEQRDGYIMELIETKDELIAVRQELIDRFNAKFDAQDVVEDAELIDDEDYADDPDDETLDMDEVDADARDQDEPR